LDFLQNKLILNRVIDRTVYNM